MTTVRFVTYFSLQLLKKKFGHPLTEICLRLILNHAVIENTEKPIQVSYFRALKSSFLLIFLATLIYRLLDQFVTKQIEGIIRSQDGISSIIWFWAALSLITSILFPTIVSVICLFALRNNSVRNLARFFGQKFEMTVLETIRSWGVSILWGFLFIIPGIIKMSFYYLVNFVVLFLPEYEDGKIDALKKSEEISKHHWVKLNLMVTLFYLIIPVITSTIFDEYTVFDKHPYSAISYTAIEAVFALLFHYTVLKMFLPYFIPPEIPVQGGPDVTYV